MDGLLIGLCCVVGSSAGLTMAGALALEMCFLGMATSTCLAKHRVRTHSHVLITVVLPLFIMLGGVMGGFVLSYLSGPPFVGVVSFGVAALLWLVTEELMIEAHADKEADTTAVTLMFFWGFIMVVMLNNAT